jgi:CubicO group peptidase (beta-lactamase class C family)
MFQRVLPLLLCTVVWSLPVHAQTAALDSIDRYVRAEMARQRIPGFSLAVLRGDSILLARGYGEANVEHHVPATDSTVYQSGSVGKQFTAAGVMLLVEDGKITLDDSITRHIPELPASWRSITIRHLLSHTSGIPDYADSTLDYRRDYTEDDLVRLAASLSPAFAPGERWSYSNTGYLLLGILIRRVTGTFYGDFLRERIFAPLGMGDTRIISEADIIPRRADGYRLVKGVLEHQQWVSPSLNTTADGSLYLTVRDLAKWAVNLNHPAVPSAASVAAGWTPIRLNGGGSYSYGFGWAVDPQRGYRHVGHGGSWQGFRASIQRYPDFGVTVIVLANLAQARVEAMSRLIAGILEPALTPPHALPAPLAGPAPAHSVMEVARRAIVERDTTLLTPGYARFLLAQPAGNAGAMFGQLTDWTPLGCEDLGDRAFERLGATAERACYARAAFPQGGVLFEVLYAENDRITDIQPYTF